MIKQKFRQTAGGVINREKSISFTFNNKRLYGYDGDTLASALLANGIHLVSRSFKTHRARGIMSAGTEEAGAIVQISKNTPKSQPNMRATEVLIYDGLAAQSVNAWPSVKFDIASINKLFSKYLFAGFYYKTFMWPKSFWKLLYEPMIRQMGGLGKCDIINDDREYERNNDFFDLVIIGAGKAGLEYAEQFLRTHKTKDHSIFDKQSTNDTTLKILLVDENPLLYLNKERIQKLGKEINVLTHTTVFGYYDNNYLCAVEHVNSSKIDQRIWHITAKQVVLATGAIERPFVFKNNDLPGIMLANSVQTYISRFGVRCGKDAVVFTNNDSAYQVAFDMKAAGINVKAIIDIRKTSPFEGRTDIPIFTQSVILEAQGKNHIKSVTVSQIKSDEQSVYRVKQIISCDLLAVSSGWTPSVHLHSQAGGKLSFDDDKACFVPTTTEQNNVSIGACNGDFSFDISSISKKWEIENGIGKSSYVDFLEDVSALDIRIAAKEGMSSVELLKRYTTVGMGVDQGKTSNVNAIGILANALDKPIDLVGTTRFRAPYTCVNFGALAGKELGDLLDPVRTTPIHDWHVDHGAVFEDVGQWKRPWYFPRTHESMQETLNRECLAVRTSVGMMDASTLGKIDIQGKDSGKFLDLIYTNMFSSLKVGSVKYGLMCHEDGMIFDDGVTAKIAENHYYMTTTTGGAANVLDWMEYWLQTEYPDWEVYLTSITEQYCAIAVSGPHVKKVMKHVFPEESFSNESFTFMTSKDILLNGINIRVLRISFTGELAFELHVPSYHGKEIWEQVYQAGKPYAITPYGTETMHILRAEKGFIIAGQETDGSVTPLDLDMNWIVSKKKDFLGKRSFLRKDTSRKNRKKLVGIITKDPKVVLPEGAQLVKDPHGSIPVNMEGHVTSSYYSATLKRSIALALINGGLENKGKTLYAPIEGSIIPVEVTSPVFYDPKGDRQHAE
ncbi:FAD-dependent oxidoreductase [bacterium]|jgi:sarcosine oxidase, subunit alpha|nr:FAD-dependent oxidoreductase [bacterium]